MDNQESNDIKEDLAHLSQRALKAHILYCQRNYFETTMTEPEHWRGASAEIAQYLKDNPEELTLLENKIEIEQYPYRVLPSNKATAYCVLNDDSVTINMDWKFGTFTWPLNSSIKNSRRATASEILGYKISEEEKLTEAIIHTLKLHILASSNYGRNISTDFQHGELCDYLDKYLASKPELCSYLFYAVEKELNPCRYPGS